MSNLFRTLLSISLVYLMFYTPSCQNEPIEPTPADCTIKAFYRGTLVCYRQGGTTAAVQLAFNDKYLILPNFFELVEMGSVDYDDVLYIEYEDVDFTDTSPELCGYSIVAPITTLTCATVE